MPQRSSGLSDRVASRTCSCGRRPQPRKIANECGLCGPSCRAGERLRWRDTDGKWHDVALPDDLTKPSIALAENRKQLWVSGVVGDTPKLFSTSADAK